MPRDWFWQYCVYLPLAAADPVTRSLTLQYHEIGSDFLLEIN